MAFYINGTLVHEPKQGGVMITDEPVWSANTGRGSDGVMTGHIVDWKTTIAITWAPLSFSEAKKIVDAIKGGGTFFPLKYNDVYANGGTEQQKTVYASNVPRALYSLAAGKKLATDVTVTFVEK